MASYVPPTPGIAANFDLDAYGLDVPRSAWVPGWRDPVTGVLARAGFEARLQSAIAGAAEGEMIAVLWIDIDRFHRIDARLGPDVADHLLRAVATRLQAEIDAQDGLGRIGGDEFAILSTTMVSETEVARLAERVLAGLSGVEVQQAGQTWRLSVSIGYATADARDCRPLSLVRSAQAALHAAKLSGRGRAVSAAKLLAPPLRGRETMRLDLDHAIRSRTLALVWQPYIDAHSGENIGFEALMRWNRPGHGETSPAVFIPEAEASGLIGDLDIYVLRAACLAGAGWRRPWRVNVNVSSYWFTLGRIAEIVASVLNETGMPGNRLLIEITERTCIENAELARQQIEALRKLGVRIALDDFGTGFSSLATITDIEVDEIKLDRSLVRQVGVNPRAELVLKSVIGLAQGLGVEICAEGIETPAQRDVLAGLGSTFLQGYLIGRPGDIPLD